MKLYGADYVLSEQALRIAVAGVSGTGKSTMCRKLAAARGLSYTELDSLFHAENWGRRESFESDVDAILAGESWVTEFQYAYAKPHIADRAHVLVWLDLPVRVAMSQMVKRTWLRWWRREELWNGNREPGPLMWLQPRDENILWWAWKSRNSLRSLDVELEAVDVVLVRLRSRAEVERWSALNHI